MKDRLDIEDKKAWVQGLLVDCPLGEALDACPARDLRSLPIKTRLKLVRDMTEDEVNQVIAHHEACLMKRESWKTRTQDD